MTGESLVLKEPHWNKLPNLYCLHIFPHTNKFVSQSLPMQLTSEDILVWYVISAFGCNPKASGESTNGRFSMALRYSSTVRHLGIV